MRTCHRTGAVSVSDEDTSGAPRLVAVRCGRCGTLTFPQQHFCPSCWAPEENLSQEDLPRRGRVYAFSVAHVGSAGIDPPYAAGMVDLDDGTRVSARFAYPDDLRMGDRVEAVSALVHDTEGWAVGCVFEVRP
jgi:uncharacterized OB-fold protein